MLFPPVPLPKLMQVMRLVMAVFPIALQEFLLKDVLVSCLIYVVCFVYPSRLLIVLTALGAISFRR